MQAYYETETEISESHQLILQLPDKATQTTAAQTRHL